jgi:hypothetical protein
MSTILHPFHLGGIVQTPITGHEFIFLIPFVYTAGSLPYQITDQVILHLHEVFLERTGNIGLKLNIGEVQEPYLDMTNFQQLGCSFPGDTLDIQDEVY